MTLGVKCELSLFKDRDTRDRKLRIFREVFEWIEPELFIQVSQMKTIELVALVYSRIKESKIVAEPVLNDEGEPILDNEGNPTFNEVESNWFHDAEDVLE